MDAVIYIRDMQRMCKSHISCNGCELKPGNGKSCMEGMDPQECISVVEQWAVAHPTKTRQSEFLKLFPNVSTDDGGVIDLLPCELGEVSKTKCMEFHGCADCRRKFWLAEVEE